MCISRSFNKCKCSYTSFDTYHTMMYLKEVKLIEEPSCQDFSTVFFSFASMGVNMSEESSR